MRKLVKQMMLPLLFTLGVLLLTAWLFFDFAAVSWLLLCYVPVDLYCKWKEQKRQGKWELNLAFKDALVCLENSLAVGYSPESSVLIRIESKVSRKESRVSWISGITDGSFSSYPISIKISISSY